jgi:hypothetical protein
VQRQFLLNFIFMIKPSDCTVFIQVWVDTRALRLGLTHAVYVVDNCALQKSSEQGTGNLNSKVFAGSDICWTILNVDTLSELDLELLSISASWKSPYPPQRYSATQWTGQVPEISPGTYTITFHMHGDGTSIKSSVSPAITTIQ